MAEINSDAQLQKEVSFLNLIENKKILIPKIQRDYAQGRLDVRTTEIRDGFITSIVDSLTQNDVKPLLLDFIYGSTQENKVFTPLDGQQRLTTLFLLHWYLVPKEKSNLLQMDINNSIYSKFSYETRISSRDFCNALVKTSISDLRNSLEELLTEKEFIANATSGDGDIINLLKEINDIKALLVRGSLSRLIITQSWFLWSWRNDPTIKAILVMLDEFDLRLGNDSEEQKLLFWDKLEKGSIVFHSLPLEQFNLSDELYVKMNARGKELSPFDIFKSTLEEQMRINCVNEELQNRWRENIDSNWIDLFWNKLAKPFIGVDITIEKQRDYVNSVEEGYLSFLKRMMEFHLLLNDNCFNCNWSDQQLKKYIPFQYEVSDTPIQTEIEFIITNLRDYPFNSKKFKDADILDLMPLFNRAEFFNNDFFQFVTETFETLIYINQAVKHEGSDLIEGINFENENRYIFDSFISPTIDYETRVQFFALIKFLKYNHAERVQTDCSLKGEFNSWMRIIRNLSTNTNSYFYNTSDDFIKSLRAIEKWATSIYKLSKFNSIYDYFNHSDDLQGFNMEQLKEEKIKVNLFGQSDNWETLIRAAEERPYFLGQIRFLLEWSINAEGFIEVENFKKYLKKVNAVFDDNGLREELIQNNRFRNALLANTDWYLFNDSFIQNSNKSRDYSWKRYLRENSKSVNIKRLLDKWDMSQKFTEFLEKEIENTKLHDWRKFFLEKPEIYSELQNSRIGYWNYENGEICLLSKQIWSSKHKELFTYYLHIKYNNGTDEYLDSTKEQNCFTAIFKKSNEEGFSIQFIPKWDEKWERGTYLLACNFTPNISGFHQNLETLKWVKTFDSGKFDEIEEVISILNK